MSRKKIDGLEVPRVLCLLIHWGKKSSCDPLETRNYAENTPFDHTQAPNIPLYCSTPPPLPYDTHFGKYRARNTLLIKVRSASSGAEEAGW